MAEKMPPKPAAKPPAKPVAKPAAKPAAKAPAAKPAAKAPAKASAVDRAYEKAKRGMPVLRKETEKTWMGPRFAFDYAAGKTNVENNKRALRELNRRSEMRYYEKYEPSVSRKEALTVRSPGMDAYPTYLGQATKAEKKARQQAERAIDNRRDLKGPEIVGPKIVGPKLVGPKVPKGSGSKSGMSKRGPARPMM